MWVLLPQTHLVLFMHTHTINTLVRTNLVHHHDVVLDVMCFLPSFGPYPSLSPVLYSASHATYVQPSPCDAVPLVRNSGVLDPLLYPAQHHKSNMQTNMCNLITTTIIIIY